MTKDAQGNEITAGMIAAGIEALHNAGEVPADELVQLVFRAMTAASDAAHTGPPPPGPPN